MNCCGEREKLRDVKAEQKWDYINLSDFKSSSCWTGFSYGVLYISLVISVAVYGVDTFTAANLLFFNRWSGQVKPVIPFKISKWIFAGCILLSFALLVYRWFKAIRAIKTGIVAASYLDPLAVRVQSVRTGANGQGWRRFLVFTALTKHRKGAEYVALFTYFSFEAWLRIVFAEGPRQVINALTLYSVMQANLIPEGEHAANHGHSALGQFFVNVQILADHNRQQAAILFSMLFTLVIWVFSALGLITAVLFYLVFLWHHIPRADNGLSGYCRRKVDSRLHKIVGVKVNKALARGNKALNSQDANDGMIGGRPPIKRQPTVPVVDIQPDDKLQEMPLLQRQGTQATLPPYTSNPPSRNPSDSSSAGREPAIPNIFTDRPTAPERSATQNSNRSDASYASNAPLIRAAGDMAYGQPGSNFSRPPPVRMESERSNYSERPRVGRSDTYNSQGSQRYHNAEWRREPPAPQNGSYAPPRGPPSRQNTGLSDYVQSTPFPFPAQNRKPTPQNLPLDAIGKRTPTPTNRYLPPPMPVQEFEMRPQPPPASSTGPPEITSRGYVAFNPANSNVLPASVPSRNFTQPDRRAQPDHTGQQSTPQRSGTAPLPQTIPYDDSIYDEYRKEREPERPGRAATAGPGTWNGQAPPIPRVETTSSAAWNGGRGNRPGPGPYVDPPRPARAGTADPYTARQRPGLPARAGTADPEWAGQRRYGPGERGPGFYPF